MRGPLDGLDPEQVTDAKTLELQDVDIEVEVQSVPNQKEPETSLSSKQEIIGPSPRSVRC